MIRFILSSKRRQAQLGKLEYACRGGQLFRCMDLSNNGLVCEKTLDLEKKTEEKNQVVSVTSDELGDEGLDQPTSTTS